MGTSDRTLVQGFGFTGFRSFHGPLRGIGPLTGLNVVAGANNAGKSNVLRFAERVLPRIDRSSQAEFINAPPLEGLDVPRSDEEVPVQMCFAIRASDVRQQFSEHGDVGQEIIERLLSLRAIQVVPGLDADLQEPSSSQKPLRPDQLIWIRYIGVPGTPGSLEISQEQVEDVITEWGSEWNNVRSDWVKDHILHGGPTEPRNVMKRFLGSLFLSVKIPKVTTIPTTRSIDSDLIIQLAELQNPNFDDLEKSDAKFAAINDFARAVLENENVQLRIPSNRETILVRINDRTLPLENLGTGIHQVIIMAATATTHERTLICIEEPESYLHPVLQRKLATFLSTHTSNQYLVATHSAHLLDHENATVFHLTLSDLGSRITAAKKPHELNAVCGDLGYRPSDLLQANCVIWVEGPSDRIYLRRWLDLASDDDIVALTEDTHYTIMFFGGALMSHLSVDEDALEDFIRLRRLNRHSVILFDLDRTRPDEKASPTKLRIMEEYKREGASPGFAWITAGYTIENYLPRNILEDAVRSVYAGSTLTGEDEQWDNPLQNLGGGVKFDKVAIAREASRNLTKLDLGVLDLRENLNNLKEFIRVANGEELPRS